MSDARKQSMAILAQVAEFLANLPEDQLDDLQSGAARLALIPAGSDQPLVPTSRSTRSRAAKAPAVDVAQVVEGLHTADDREAAAALLKPLKTPELKEVMSQLGITLAGSQTRDKVITAIIERTVGNRLDSLAIRGTSTLPY